MTGQEAVLPTTHTVVIRTLLSPTRPLMGLLIQRGDGCGWAGRGSTGYGDGGRGIHSHPAGMDLLRSVDYWLTYMVATQYLTYFTLSESEIVPCDDAAIK